MMAEPPDMPTGLPSRFKIPKDCVEDRERIRKERIRGEKIKIIMRIMEWTRSTILVF